MNNRLKSLFHSRKQLFVVSLFYIVMFLWLSELGMSFYSKVIPFYDSLSFQEKYFQIIDSYKNDGYLKSLKLGIAPSNTFAYQFMAGLMAPILPRSIIGLYVIAYGLTVFSLISIFVIGRKITNSGFYSFSYVLLILAVPIASNTLGGIVDQRLDLFGGYLFLATTLTGWVYFSNLKDSKMGLMFILLSFFLFVT